MYRDYENTVEIEQRIAYLKEVYKETPYFDIKLEIHDEIEDLEERLNFAYQDEYEEEY